MGILPELASENSVVVIKALTLPMSCHNLYPARHGIFHNHHKWTTVLGLKNNFDHKLLNLNRTNHCYSEFIKNVVKLKIKNEGEKKPVLRQPKLGRTKQEKEEARKAGKADKIRIDGCYGGC